MIETRVRVLRAGQGRAWVEATEANGCGACQAKSACALSGLGRFFASRRQPIPVWADDARPGQQYRVAVAEADLLRAGLVAYLLPSLLAVLGAAAATVRGLGDAGAVTGMVLGFLLGVLLAGRYSNRVAPGLALVPLDHEPHPGPLSSNQGETP